MIIRTTTTAVYYPIVTRRTGSIRGTGRVRFVRLGVGLESVASAGDSNQLSVVEQSIQDGAGRQVHRLAAYLLLGLPKLLERVERSGFVEGPESRHV